jgi:hypothetical protein
MQCRFLNVPAGIEKEDNVFYNVFSRLNNIAFRFYLFPGSAILAHYQ